MWQCLSSTIFTDNASSVPFSTTQLPIKTRAKDNSGSTCRDVVLCDWCHGAGLCSLLIQLVKINSVQMLSGEGCGLFRWLLADGRAFSLHLTLLRFSSPSLTATAFTRFSKALFWRSVSVWSLCYCCFYDVTLLKSTCIDGV